MLSNLCTGHIMRVFVRIPRPTTYDISDADQKILVISPTKDLETRVSTGHQYILGDLVNYYYNSGFLPAITKGKIKAVRASGAEKGKPVDLEGGDIITAIQDAAIGAYLAGGGCNEKIPSPMPSIPSKIISRGKEILSGEDNITIYSPWGEGTKVTLKGLIGFYEDGFLPTNVRGEIRCLSGRKRETFKDNLIIGLIKSVLADLTEPAQETALRARLSNAVGNLRKRTAALLIKTAKIITPPEDNPPSSKQI